MNINRGEPVTLARAIEIELRELDSYIPALRRNGYRNALKSSLGIRAELVAKLSALSAPQRCLC